MARAARHSQLALPFPCWRDQEPSSLGLSYASLPFGLPFTKSKGEKEWYIHEWQHASLPCPSLSPWICSNACPLSWWCHLLISSSAVAPSPLPSVFPSIRVFSNESAFCTRWPKYWSFSSSSSPFNEYSGLISFRSNWFDLLAVQGTLKSLL